MVPKNDVAAWPRQLQLQVKTITVALPEDVLVAIDRYVAANPGATRSGIFAVALREWLSKQQDTEIERYYRSMTDEERVEDSAWCAVAAQSAARVWS